jgi:hypothetical protein
MTNHLVGATIGLMMHTHRQGASIFVGKQIGFGVVADLPGLISSFS